jgi:hypothetical protein
MRHHPPRTSLTASAPSPRWWVPFLAVAASSVALLGCNGDDAADRKTNSGGSAAAGGAPTSVIPVDPHATGREARRAADGDSTESPGCYSASFPRRLTRAQFVNALTDWSAALITDTGLPARIQTLVVDTAQFPLDASVNPETARHQGYYRLDPTVTTRQVTSIYTVARALAADLASTDARAATIVGNCSGSACLDAFVRKAGRILFRAPLTDAEVAVYTRAAGGATDRAAVTKVLATMIASPQAYFVVERGTTPGDTSASCVPLSGPELATRLSLHLWDTIPDAALRADADSGALLQPSVYARHVARLMADSRADAGLRSFFRQWLELDDVVAMNGKVGDPKFDAFAGNYRPLSTTRDAAVNEVLDLVSYVASRNGSLQQVMTDRHSFARTADIAALYNTPVWNGSGTPPLFTEAERVGLMTRVAILVNGSSDTTLPIQRGAKVLRSLTCQTLPPPAMNQTNAAADLSGVLSTRQRTERITEMPGTACVDCHVGIINPWGFVLEGFDSLGRVRNREVVRNDAGASMGEVPLNTAVTVRLATLGARGISTAAQAQQYVLESGEVERCFARNYFRYVFGRADTASDGEVIDTLRRQAANGANLRSLFASVVTRDEFKSIQRPQ